MTSTRLRSGFETCELGAQFTNRNVYGEQEWTTHAEIVRFEPERELTDSFMRGQDAFTASQLAGMRETLERIKTRAEARR